MLLLRENKIKDMQTFKVSLIDFLKGLAMIIGFYVMSILFIGLVIVGLFGLKDVGVGIAVVVTLIMVIISIYRLYVSFKYRCVKCGKLNAAREIDRKEIDRERITIYKKVYDKATDSVGKTIRTIVRNVPVSAFSITYDVLKECKHCDKRYIVRKKVVQEI